MKRFLCLIGIILLVALSAGCEKHVEKEVLEVQSNENMMGWISDESSSGIVTLNAEDSKYAVQDKSTGEEIYKEVLSQYREVVKENFYLDTNLNTENQIGEYINQELLQSARYVKDETFNIYYALKDIDGNGIDELLIGASGEGEPIHYYDIFVFDGRSPKKLFNEYEFGYRTNFMCYSKGIIGVSGSGTAIDSVSEFYSISEDGCTPRLLECISVHGNPDNYAEAVKYYHSNDRVDEISREQYLQIREQYTAAGTMEMLWRKIHLERDFGLNSERKRIEINENILTLLGRSCEDIIEVCGAPKEDSGYGNFHSRQLVYDTFSFEILKSTGKVWMISGAVKGLFDMGGAKEIQLENFIEDLDIADSVNFVIAEGAGDYDFEYGTPYIDFIYQEYQIRLMYDNKRNQISENAYFMANIDVNNVGYIDAEMKLSVDQMEEEVKRIRQVYNQIVTMSDSGKYSKKILPNGEIAFYDESNKIRQVIVKKDHEKQYTRYYYYENSNLIFAYLENDDAHRLYYHNRQLFRWRYTQDSTVPDIAVNHDNEESEEFRSLGNLILQEAESYLQY